VLGRIRRIAIDVLRDPLVEPDLHIRAFLERADLVAHDALQIMRKAVASKEIRQPRGKRGIRGRVRIFILERLLQRLRADERREIRVLAMNQRHETVLRQFRLTPV